MHTKKQVKLQLYLQEIGERFNTLEIRDLLQRVEEKYRQTRTKEQMAPDQETHSGEMISETKLTFIDSTQKPQTSGSDGYESIEAGIKPTPLEGEERGQEDEQERQEKIAETNKLISSANQSRIAGNFIEATKLFAQGIEICQKWDIKDNLDEIYALKRDLDLEIDKISENLESFSMREEVFQNYLADENYIACIEMIPEMLELAEQNHQPREMDHYAQLKIQIEKAYRGSNRSRIPMPR